MKQTRNNNGSLPSHGRGHRFNPCRVHHFCFSVAAHQPNRRDPGRFCDANSLTAGRDASLGPALRSPAPIMIRGGGHP
jgi:hypothetical protein